MRLAALLIGALWMTACASAGGGGNAARVAELEVRVLELQRKAAMAEVEIDRLQRRLQEMEHGGVQSAARRVAPPAATSSPEAVDVVAPVPPAALPVEAADLDDSEVASADRDATGNGLAAVPPAGQALYDQGYTLYHQGRTLDAEGYFQRFLLAYGTSDLADNAQFWIGASRLARGDAEGAAAAFREGIERYPDGNKVPDALLKLGESLERQGDQEGARRSWEEVVRRFPASDAAVVAVGRLR